MTKLTITQSWNNWETIQASTELSSDDPLGRNIVHPPAPGSSRGSIWIPTLLMSAATTPDSTDD